MLGVSRASAGEMLKRLEAEGSSSAASSKEAILTETGRARAERVVRKHRIIERLLTDFMGYTAAEAHVHADELGDTFNDDMVERIEERLGHPERCRTAGRSTPTFEQAENRELEPLAGARAGRARDDRAARRARRRPAALVLRRGLDAGRRLRGRRGREGAGQFSVRLNGGDRAIGHDAAAGLFVRPV